MLRRLRRRTVIGTLVIGILAVLIGGTLLVRHAYRLTGAPPPPTVTAVSPPTGPTSGGTTVTVTGTNFVVGGTTVTFGGVTSPTVNVQSSTQLTAVTPLEAPGDAYVQVSTSGGGSVTTNNGIFAFIPQGPYQPMTAFRLCDTRAGTGTECSTGSGLAATSSMNLQVTGVTVNGESVPTGAAAVDASITVIPHYPANTPEGYLTVFPTGSLQPATSNILFGQNTTGLYASNLVEVPLSPSGQITIYSSFGNTIDFIVDVEGYTQNSLASNAGGYLNPVVPARVCDTRTTYPTTVCTGQIMHGGGGTFNVQVGGGTKGMWSGGPVSSGIPATGISAVTVQITVDTPTATGSVVAFAYGSSPTATTDFLAIAGAGQRSVRAVVPVGYLNGNAEITVQYNAGTSSDTTSLAVDVTGWYSSTTSAQGLVLNSNGPVRICDTRGGSGTPCAGTGPYTAGSDHVVQIAGLGGLPAMGGSNQPVAAIVNMTVTDWTGASYITAYDADYGSGQAACRPDASDLNFGATNQQESNLLLVIPLSTGAASPFAGCSTAQTQSGQIVIHNNAAQVDVILDLIGYYTGNPNAPQIVKTYQLPPGGGTVPGVTNAVSKGQVVPYSLAVSNATNTAMPVGAVTVTDPLPASLTLDTSSVQVGSSACPVNPSPTPSTVYCTLAGGLLTVHAFPQINAYSTVTVTFNAVATAAGADSRCIVAQNAATASELDPNNANSTLTTTSTSAPLTICDTGVGRAAWWSFVDRSTGALSQAGVNVANGNLVLQQQDSTTVQVHGRLALGLTRTYNSQETSLVTGLGVDGVTPFGSSLGKGWTFNVSGAGDAGDEVTAPDGLYVPSVMSATDPAAVTLIDQTGAHHVFQPKGIGAALALTSLPTTLSPAVLHTDAPYVALCADQTYTAPAGVHLTVVRYVEARSTCSDLTYARVVGFVAMRGDRLRSEYSWDGHLLDVRDGAGNELRYNYSGSVSTAAAIGNLVSITEPATGRGFQFSTPTTGTAPWNSSLQVGVLTVTDPAGRVTTYYTDNATGAAAAFFTSHLIRVVNPDGSFVAYTYGGCGGTVDQLCSAQDPRGNTTQLTYTSTYSDGSTQVVGLPLVAHVTDRRGTTTAFSYSTGSGSPSTTSTTVTEQSEQSLYKQIDASGRVAEIDSGPTNGTALHTTTMSWDSAGGTVCQQPTVGSGVDNNLCSQTRTGGGSTPNELTAFTYNPEGKVLKEDRTASPEHLVTTYGYTAEYAPAGGTATLTQAADRPAGSGAITSDARPSSYLFYLSDRTALLPPRGNSPSNQGTFASYESTYVPDNLATASPNVKAPSSLTTYCSASGSATANTGAVCEQDAPATKTGDAQSITRYQYDWYGQKSHMLTPQAIDTSGAAYTYTYYQDSDKDLSATTVAGGWLRAVTDPTGHFVAFAYDAAGNVTRTWDRNQTTAANCTDSVTLQACTVSSFPSQISSSSPAATRYAETLHGSGSTAYSAPWRYVLSQRDPLGNVTAFGVDGNGNQTSITPPKGSAETISQHFDAGDLLTTRTLPVVAPATSNTTTYAYDAFGNRTSTTDANGHVTVSVYDAVNRLVETDWTQDAGTTATPGCTPSSLLPSGHPELCIKTTLDAVDNAASTVDANGHATTNTFDAAHRRLTSVGPRQVSGHGTTTQWVYDDDGHVTDVCSPREFTEGTGQCPGGHFTTHTAYGPAGEVDSTTTYRQQDLTASPVVWTSEMTAFAYDADGNRTSATDPRGSVTTDGYDLLDRRVSETGPRSSSQVTRWVYDGVGNVSSVTMPPAATAASGETTSRITAYAYDPDNRLIDTVRGASSTDANAASTTDSLGGTNIRTRVYYDADGHPVAWVDGRAFAGGFGPLGSPAAVPNSNAGTTQYMVAADYDADGRQVAQYVPRFDSGSTTGDTGVAGLASPQCSTAVRPQGVAGVPAFNADVTVCKTAVQRDAVGNVTLSIPPTSTGSDNRTLSMTYTDNNLPSQQSAPDPSTIGGRVTTTVGYDGDGKTTSIAQPGGRTEALTYYPDELLNTDTVASGTGDARVTSYSYDANGERTSVIDPAGVSTTTRYYADGLTALVTQGSQDATGDAYTGQFKGTTAYFYDADGNVVREYSPEAWAVHMGSSYARGTNPAGDPIVTTYTPDNLVATTTVPTASDGSQGRQVAYTYDPAGRKTQAHTYLVTGVDWQGVTTVGTPVSGGDGGTQSFVYTQNDLLTSETGRDGSTQIVTQHDAAGNRTSVQQGSAPPLTATYYLDDLARTVTDTNGKTTRYSYDGLGSVVGRQEASTSSGTGPTTTYSYGEAEQPSSLTSDVLSGGKVTWQYFSSGLLHTQQHQSSSGGVQLQTTWSYNADDSVASRTLTNAAQTTTLAAWTYGRDSGGRVTSQTFSGQTATAGSVVQGAFAYTYNAAGRLASFQNQGTSGPVQAITWDHDGNRLSYGGTGPTTAYTCYRPDNSIAFTQTATSAPSCGGGTPVGAQGSTYAAFGGLTADGCSTYAYDPFDRLSQATGSTGVGCTPGTVSYGYDGLDRQVSHTETVGTTAVHYDGLSNTLAVETPPSGGDVSYALSPHGLPEGVSQGSTLQLLADDGQGSVSTAVNTSAQVQCTARFDPFGTPVMGTVPNPTPGAPKGCSSGSTPSDLFYRGGRQDQTTGQYQFGSRTYDPGKDAFLTPDSYRTAQPAATQGLGVDPLTENTYAYVNGDPINLVDPTGHNPCSSEGVDLMGETGCTPSENGALYASDRGAAGPAAAAAGFRAGLAYARGIGRAIDAEFAAAAAQAAEEWAAEQAQARFQQLVDQIDSCGFTCQLGNVAGGLKRVGSYCLSSWGAGSTCLAVAAVAATGVGAVADVGVAGTALWAASSVASGASFAQTGNVLDAAGAIPALGVLRELRAAESAIAAGADAGKLAGAAVRAGDEAAGALHVTDSLSPDAKAFLNAGPANTYVYNGLRDGKDVYTGITNNIARRQAEHGDRFLLDPLTDVPVTRGQARAIEQAQIVANPEFENIANSISPSHPYYEEVVDWGRQWLENNP